MLFLQWGVGSFPWSVTSSLGTGGVQLELCSVGQCRSSQGSIPLLQGHRAPGMLKSCSCKDLGHQECSIPDPEGIQGSRNAHSLVLQQSRAPGMLLRGFRAPGMLSPWSCRDPGHQECSIPAPAGTQGTRNAQSLLLKGSRAAGMAGPDGK